MKIAIITTLPPVNTSLSEYGKFLTEGLLKVSPDAEIHVLADVPADHASVKEMADARLDVERVWHFNDWKNPLRILGKVLALKPDMVVFNLQFASFGQSKVPAMLGLAAPMLLRRMGFEVVTVLHNLPEAMDLSSPHFSKSRLDKWMLQKGCEAATHMLLQSSRLVVTLDKYKQILEDKYQAKNVDVIGLGSYLEPATEVSMTQKNSFLTFGKFGTYKRLEFLLDAFQAVSKQCPDIELVIGGADHPATPGYMQAMEAKYGHLKNVKFIGWIEDEALPGLIQDAKAVVLSYESTAGSSGPLHLAMSQGKVAIAPNFGDFERVAENEGLEILFYEHQNLSALQDQLLAVAMDQVDLRKMGQKNLNLARLNSADNTARRYLNLLESLVPETGAVAPQQPVLKPQFGFVAQQVKAA